MTEKQKSDGMLTFLATILGKDDISKEFNQLVVSLKTLTDEVVTLAKSVNRLSKTLDEYGVAISDLYAIQAIILQQISQDPEVDHHPKDSKSKNKIEKPN
jgi:hypothetical protein